MGNAEEFALWLQAEMDRHDWTQADLSRISNISKPQIARVLSGSRGIGPDACNAIARALRLPPELVFRKAGLLPPSETSEDEDIERTNHILPQLPEAERKMVLAFAEYLSQRHQKGTDYERKGNITPTANSD